MLSLLRPSLQVALGILRVLQRDLSLLQRVLKIHDFQVELLCVLSHALSFHNVCIRASCIGLGSVVWRGQCVDISIGAWHGSVSLEVGHRIVRRLQARLTRRRFLVLRVQLL